MCFLRMLQGRLAEIVSVALSIRDFYPNLAWAADAMAPATLAEAGAEAQARARLKALGPAAPAAMPPNFQWTFAITMLARAAYRLDDRARRKPSTPMMLPFAERNGLLSGVGFRVEPPSPCARGDRSPGASTTPSGTSEAALVANGRNGWRSWVV